MKRPAPEPFLWLLFSGGGMATALLVPVLLVLFGLAFPIGWLPFPEYGHLLALLRNPLTKLVLFGLCVLALFHWAHRFRYTLHEGLQLKRLKPAIVLACYGAAVVGSVVAGAVLVGV